MVHWLPPLLESGNSRHSWWVDRLEPKLVVERAGGLINIFCLSKLTGRVQAKLLLELGQEHASVQCDHHSQEGREDIGMMGNLVKHDEEPRKRAAWDTLVCSLFTVYSRCVVATNKGVVGTAKGISLQTRLTV